MTRNPPVVALSIRGPGRVAHVADTVRLPVGEWLVHAGIALIALLSASELTGVLVLWLAP